MSALSPRVPFAPSRYSFRLRPETADVPDQIQPGFDADEGISLPYNHQHLLHVQHDYRNGQYIGIPRDWEERLRDEEDIEWDRSRMCEELITLAAQSLSESEETRSVDNFVTDRLTRLNFIEEGVASNYPTRSLVSGLDDSLTIANEKTHYRNLSSGTKKLRILDALDAIEGQNDVRTDGVIPSSSAPLPQTTVSDMVAFMTPRTPIDVEVVSPERPLEAKQRRRGTIWRDLPLKLSTPEVLSRKRNSPLDITGQLTREAYGKSEPTSKGITAHADTSEDKHVRKPSVQRPSSALRSSAYVPVGVTYGRHRLLIASVTVPEDTEMHRRVRLCCV
ncbi:hypothetical protein CERSUDRAFT_72405 [Gelatoporia subvermispora B]|uniref:CRIB domain-containing protein n=1 Tax=Ceriporiopsis subvermispora (strain B) TaxID=914234 RepID=M2RK62_CERS8|nr:hypothetical protein CERSUDRAFT_72405 [Gelatoporia subvermispora B]